MPKASPRCPRTPASHRSSGTSSRTLIFLIAIPRRSRPSSRSSTSSPTTTANASAMHLSICFLFSAPREMPGSSAPHATSLTSWSRSSRRRKAKPSLILPAALPASLSPRTSTSFAATLTPRATAPSRLTTAGASPKTSRATTSRPTWCASPW